MSKKVIQAIGVAAAAIVAGGLTGNIAASGTQKTVETEVSIQQDINTTQNNKTASNSVNTQSQPIIDRRLGSSNSNTGNVKLRPNLHKKQKYKKHTNRLKCKHNAKLKRRKK